MKTKIFVCSNSGIDYMPHSLNIKSIPVILHFSEEEQYEDFLDVSIDAFYSRIRYDENANIKVIFQTYVKLCEYIEEAKSEGYERVLFILAAKEFSDLYIPVKIAVTENKDIECHIYNSDTVSFPLAHMANEADSMFIGGADVKEVFEKLDYIKNNSKILYFIPNCIDESLNSFKSKYQNGKLFTLEDGKLLEIKVKNSTSYNKLITTIINETDNEDALIFSLYTDKSSIYLNLFDKSISEITGEHKKIKQTPITPGVGVYLGSYVVGLGYVIK